MSWLFQSVIPLSLSPWTCISFLVVTNGGVSVIILCWSVFFKFLIIKYFKHIEMWSCNRCLCSCHTNLTIANVLPYLIQTLKKKNPLKPFLSSLLLDYFCFLPRGNHYPEVAGYPSGAHLKTITFLKNTNFFLFYLFIFRERGREGEREGERHQCVVASRMSPTRDLACNPGMCSDWE